MKMFLTACLITLLPVAAFAQSVTLKPPEVKDKPFQPVLAQDHSGLGRIGVRLTFNKAGIPVIASMTRGGPASDFGLRVGDALIKIDKNLTTTLTEDEIHLALRGEPGTGVELTIQRDDDPNYIVRSVERRILRADAEEMVSPPMSSVARP